MKHLLPCSPDGKQFTWSYSAINDFETCPFQYAAKRYYKTVVQEDTEALIYGNLVHKALEDRLGPDRIPLHDNYKDFEKWARVIENRGFPISVEEEFCITLQREFVDWFAPDAWGRGKIDVLLLDDDTAYIYDWKTGGKIRESQLQLELFSWFVWLKYPHIKRYVTRFIWLKHEKATGGELTRAEMPAVTKKLCGKLQAMIDAWKTETFNCNTSGLCNGWCPVEECLHWRPRRQR